MSSSNNDNSANNANAQGLEAETRENASTGIPTQQTIPKNHIRL